MRKKVEVCYKKVIARYDKSQFAIVQPAQHTETGMSATMTFDVIKEIRIGATLVMSFIRSLRRHLAAVKRLHRCIYSTSSFGVFARSENFLQIKIFYGHCLCTKKKHF